MATYASLRYDHDGSAITNTLTTATPAFSVANENDGDYTFSRNSWHLLTQETEYYDVQSCFNNTGSPVTLNSLTAPAYSFTPNVAGWYYIGTYSSGDAQSFEQLEDCYWAIYKNGSAEIVGGNDLLNASDQQDAGMIAGIIQLNGTGDYVQSYIQVGDTSSHGVSINYNGSYRKNSFFGYRVS